MRSLLQHYMSFGVHTAKSIWGSESKENTQEKEEKSGKGGAQQKQNQADRPLS